MFSGKKKNVFKMGFLTEEQHSYKQKYGAAAAPYWRKKQLKRLTAVHPVAPVHLSDPDSVATARPDTLNCVAVGVIKFRA